MAMPAQQLQEAPTFAEWLGDLAERGGLNASRLQQLLVQKGYLCTAESVRRWLRGPNVPSFDIAPYLFRVLADALPEEDVRAAFKLYMSYFRKNSHEHVVADELATEAGPVKDLAKERRSRPRRTPS